MVSDEGNFQYSFFPDAHDIDSSPPLKHTFGHVECPVCNATRDKFMYDPGQLSVLRFRDAATKYLTARKLYLKPRTWYEYCHNAKQLSKFFGEMRLHQIHVGHLQEYQQHRLENRGGVWQQKAKASKINHEMSTMQSILKQAGQWARIEQFYEPMRTPATRKPKTLTDEEEIMVFTIAAQSPEWSLAYWVASISCNTGATGTELRHIQFKDLSLSARTPAFYINPDTAKNETRGRAVFLNPTALKQMERCVERARSLGSIGPDHYLFPKRDRKTQRYDPAQPTSASWLRRQWEELRRAVGLPWLTPHCFRHQNITLRIESGQPVELVAKAVGHSSTSMTRYYTHAREDRQQEAVNAIDPTTRFGPKGVVLNFKSKSA